MFTYGSYKWSREYSNENSEALNIAVITTDNRKQKVESWNNDQEDDVLILKLHCQGIQEASDLWKNNVIPSKHTTSSFKI